MAIARRTSWTRPGVLISAAVLSGLLGGCAQQSAPLGIVVPLEKYSAEEQAALADELEKLPVNSLIVGLIMDYFELRDMIVAAGLASP